MHQIMFALFRTTLCIVLLSPVIEAQDCSAQFLLSVGATCTLQTDGTCQCNYIGAASACTTATSHACPNDLYDGDCIPGELKCNGYADCNNGTDEDNCPCVQDEFSCDSGSNCLSYDKVCDGANDCTDGADESGCVNLACPDEWMLCNDGTRCVRDLDKCDRVNHCADGSDEANCTLCPDGKHQCLAGDCIDSGSVCNNDADCDYDISDEQNCTSPSSVKCGEMEFACASDSKCIYATERCDGISDCADGSDEADCTGTCTTSGQTYMSRNMCDRVQTCADFSDETTLPCMASNPCTSEDFECLSVSVRNDPNAAMFEGMPITYCIRSEDLCDNHTHCPDGSDINYDCTSNTCPKSEKHFRCSDGSCISPSLLCDDRVDCPLGSDELGCPLKNCTASEFPCVLRSFCINATSFCDGSRDCPDGSDEPLPSCSEDCTMNHFNCTDGKGCTPLNTFCNGNKDCPDNSDEDNAHCTSGTCPTGTYQCNTSPICIAQIGVCDGIADCPDKKDELNDCPFKNCTVDEFACKNGFQCLAEDLLCNIQADCHDGSDVSSICSSLSCPSTNTTFRCPNGACIDLQELCNEINECSDGSDENGCPTSVGVSTTIKLPPLTMAATTTETVTTGTPTPSPSRRRKTKAASAASKAAAEGSQSAAAGAASAMLIPIKSSYKRKHFHQPQARQYWNQAALPKYNQIKKHKTRITKPKSFMWISGQ